VLANLEPLSTTPGAYAFAVLMGLLWGSFANVCIYRMPPTDEHPNGRSVVTPGSHCFACGKPVKWYDNVPLLSYVWLRGQCRACKAPFSARYLLVEALTGALFGLAWWFAMVPTFTEPFSVRLEQFGIDAAFIVVMVVIAFIDLDHKLILDKVTIPSIVVFYVFGLALPGHAWWTGIVGAAVGWGVPWLIGWLYLKLRDREGLGLGDGMLLAVVGALFGWEGAMTTLFGGSVLGVVFEIVKIGVGKARGSEAESEPDPAPGSVAAAVSDAEPESDPESRADDPSLLRTELPFGPYLVAAALFYMFAEPWLQLNVGFRAG
jgi:leader peptidase (prepilin peptidase)/N-methyltransferase